MTAAAPEEAGTLVLGAGIAGLACASRLRGAHRAVTVLEKSRGVGGRCATRRVEGQPVDHGLAFYHGTDPSLLGALRRLDPSDLLEGWPLRVEGDGSPCVPRSLKPGSWRLALTGGLTAFPKRIAASLDVRRETRAVGLEARDGLWEVHDHRERRFRSRELVLALPAGQSLDLIRTIGDEPRLRSVGHLLALQAHVRCLTLIAVYPAGTEAPAWDVAYPGGSRILHLASHDSAKRFEPVRTVLVLQALPDWSRRGWDLDESRWSERMLDEAGRQLGRWAASPASVEARRWRYAREAGGGSLVRPLRVDWPDGRRLGITGEGFAPGGGVQSAWRAGRMMADRLLRDGTATEPR